MGRDDDAPCGRRRNAIQYDFTGVWDFESGHDSEQGRLAAAAGPQAHCSLAGGDGERDVVHREV